MLKLVRQSGFSLLEIIIALAVFALSAATLASMSLGGYQALTRSNDRAIANGLAQEGIEAVRSIVEGAWNEMNYDQSGIEAIANQWALKGEGTVDDINGFIRTLSFVDVCRDAVEAIVPCPGDHLDVHTKLIIVNITWTNELGLISTVEQEAYLTNWDSQDWEQTDWSGGSGQAVWSDPTRYDYKDGNVTTSVVGEISLSTAETGECAGYTWHFLSGLDYNYNQAFIRVEDSLAQLQPVDEEIMGIIDTPIDTYEFDNQNGMEADIIKVNDNIYAVAYRGVNNDGFVRTVEIASDGQILNPYVDSFEFEGSDGYTPDIIHISGNTYAIVYRGRQSDGYLVTVSIDSNGNIGNSNLDSYEYNNSDSYEPRIIQASGNVYIIIYRGGWWSGGYMVTVTIETNGNIGTVIDDYHYTWWSDYDPAIIKVGSEMYMIAHDDAWSGGEMFTIKVEDNGNIIESVVDYYRFDNNSGAEPNLLQLSEDVFAVTYRGSSNDGFIKTVGVADNGQITEPAYDTLEFDTSNGYNPQLALLQDDVYGVAYHDNDDYGFVTIFHINSTTGEIDNSVLDTYNFDINAGGGYLSMVPVVGLIQAIVYDGPNNDGFMSTIELAVQGVYPTDGPDIYPQTAYTPPYVDSWIKIEEIANKDGGEIYYQISDDQGVNWYYWDGSDWSVATMPGDYNTAIEINDQLWQWQPTGDSFDFKAFLVSDGSQNVQLDALTINCSNFQIEAGTIITDEDWIRVPLANIYSNPVIVAGYYEHNNWRPISVRLKNVTSSFFDIALQEPNNNNLSNDEIYYLVVEEGVWQIDNTTLEAHTYTTGTVGSKSNWLYDTIDYSYPFASDPIILHQVMSADDTNWISTYVSNASSLSTPPGLTNFRLAMNGAEAYSSHGTETIGWIAIERDEIGVFEGTSFETKRTTDSVAGHDNGCYSFNFVNIYDVSPLIMSSQQEMDDNDGAWSVMCSRSNLSVGLHSEEDRTDDSERSHGTETHGFVAWSRPFSYSSVGDAGAFQNNGDLVSSALDMGATAKAIQTVSWTETIPVECPLCDVIVQLRSADTQGGLSTAEWSGPLGAGDSFIDPTGSLVNTTSNGDRWVQYNINLQGDGDYTPIVQDIKVNYK